MLKSALSSAFSLVPTTLRPTLTLTLPSSRGGSAQREGLIATPTKSRPPSPNSQRGAGAFDSRASARFEGSASGSPYSPGGGGGPPYSPGAYPPGMGPGGVVPPPPPSPGFNSPSPGARGAGLLRQPPMPIRRHTTEEGQGLRVAGGAPSNAWVERGLSPSGLGRGAPPGASASPSAGGVTLGPVPVGMTKRRVGG